MVSAGSGLWLEPAREAQRKGTLKRLRLTAPARAKSQESRNQLQGNRGRPGTDRAHEQVREQGSHVHAP